MTAPDHDELEAVAVVDEVLFFIDAIQNTWLKREPIEPLDLRSRHKVGVHAGRRYGVIGVTELPGDAHVRLKLAGGKGDWYVFAPHWSYHQAGGEAMPAAVDWRDWNCYVTPDLTVGEILQWDVERIPGEHAAVRQRLLATAAEFQRIRDAWGQPIGVTSFYRPEPINTALGGARSSLHVTGQAMALYPIGGSLDEFYSWIRCRWRGGVADGRRRGFVYLDTVGGGFVPGGGATPSRSWSC